MNSTNTEIEQRWIDAWNRLYEIVGGRPSVSCQLSDGSIVGLEDCKGWLQDSVYEGYVVQVEAGWVGHQEGVIVSRRLTTR